MWLPSKERSHQKPIKREFPGKSWNIKSASWEGICDRFQEGNRTRFKHFAIHRLVAPTLSAQNDLVPIWRWQVSWNTMPKVVSEKKHMFFEKLLEITLTWSWGWLQNYTWNFLECSYILWNYVRMVVLHSMKLWFVQPAARYEDSSFQEDLVPESFTQTDIRRALGPGFLVVSKLFGALRRLLTGAVTTSSLDDIEPEYGWRETMEQKPMKTLRHPNNSLLRRCFSGICK